MGAAIVVKRLLCENNATFPEELAMTTLNTRPPKIRTLADLLEQLGDIPPHRIRYDPLPGMATETDVLEMERQENRLYELVDGVLVEKAMGYRESLLAVALCTYLDGFVRPKNLGLVAGADGMVRPFPGLVRIPDVAFVSWERIPGRRVPTQPIPDLIPDLAVEILSKGNTPAEMARKREEYFNYGVRLLWLVDPDARSVTVYNSPDRSTILGEVDTLSGEDVLPGFALPLSPFFAELDRKGSD
jgi:Uma2 family endonuclease